MVYLLRVCIKSAIDVPWKLVNQQPSADPFAQIAALHASTPWVHQKHRWHQELMVKWRHIWEIHQNSRFLKPEVPQMVQVMDDFVLKQASFSWPPVTLAPLFPSGEPSSTAAINMSLAEWGRSTRGCWSAWRSSRSRRRRKNQDGLLWKQHESLGFLCDSHY